MFLVGLGCEEGFGEPATAVSSVDVAIVEKIVDVLLKNGTFMDAIVALAASNGRGSAGLDAELEAQHGAASAFGRECIPVVLNDAE